MPASLVYFIGIKDKDHLFRTKKSLITNCFEFSNDSNSTKCGKYFLTCADIDNCKKPSISYSYFYLHLFCVLCSLNSDNIFVHSPHLFPSLDSFYNNNNSSNSNFSSSYSSNRHQLISQILALVCRIK